ncbi:hypothetical protein ACOA7M_003544, partial [Vibrio cholerae]
YMEVILRRRHKINELDRSYILEVAKLKMEYAKHGSVLCMAILGGQITLLGSIFKDNDNQCYAYASIVLMLLSCILMFSFSEGVIRHLDYERINREQPWIARNRHRFMKGTTWEMIKSIIFGVYFTASIGLYLFFVSQKEILQFIGSIYT